MALLHSVHVPVDELSDVPMQVHNYDWAVLELQQAIELSRGNPLCTSQLGYVYAVSHPNSRTRTRLAGKRQVQFAHNIPASNTDRVNCGYNHFSCMWPQVMQINGVQCGFHHLGIPTT